MEDYNSSVVDDKLEIISNKPLQPVSNGLLDIISSLSSTTEELYSLYSTLDGFRDRLSFLGHDILGLTSDMVVGAGGVSQLGKGFEDYFEKFFTDEENLAFNTIQLVKEFDKLNIALPANKESFKAMMSAIDLTTSSGQELYGRL